MSERIARAEVWWPLHIGRAAATAALALAITFSADHSAGFGLVAFGLYALTEGLVLLVLSWRSVRDRVLVGVLLGRGALSVIAGAVALAAAGGGVVVLLSLVGAWAALAGCLELVAGLRGRARVAGSGDWIFTAALTLLLAIVLFALPADYVQAFSGTHGVHGLLTTSIIAVGALGAWGAVVALFLAIGGVSLMHRPRPRIEGRA